MWKAACALHLTATTPQQSAEALGTFGSVPGLVEIRVVPPY